MADHAPFSPSAAKRWLACPGSVPLSADEPNTSSVYAEEGTLAHSYAEQWLRTGHPDPAMPAPMRDHLAVYVAHVRSVMAEGACKVWYEQRVKLNDECWGTADCIVYNKDTRVLHVIDLKYGAGVFVRADENEQLKVYAAAAMLTMRLPVYAVVGTIVQPRVEHEDGPVRSAEFGTVDLLEFLDDIERAIEAAALPSPPLASGDHCRFCPAAHKCPELKKAHDVMVADSFLPVEQADGAQLAYWLSQIPLVESRIKAINERAYRLAAEGNPPPGYKLVEKRPTRKWRDEASAARWLFDQAVDAYEKKLISPAQAEKQLPKAVRGGLEQFVIKESSGLTLAPESDKRPAATPLLGFQPATQED